MATGDRDPTVAPAAAGRRVASLRNIGIVAHINAGKTTLTERILFDTGAAMRLGEVELGTATTDYLSEEQRRGISINAAVVTVDWRGYRIYLIDTPGHVDFSAEVERCLRVLDGVVVLLDGVKGVESQTLMIWRRAQQHGLPAVLFVNKMDRATADFARAVESARTLLGTRPVPIVVPARTEDGRVLLFDAVRRQLDAGDAGQAASDPFDARALRTAVEEACADGDEQVMAAFVEGTEVPVRRLDAALRAGTLAGRLLPVVGGAALRDRGVDLLLDAVCRYLPSPLEQVGGHEIDGLPRRPARTAGPFCGLVFKVQHEREARFQFVRVWAGSVRIGDPLAVVGEPEPLQVTGIASLLALDRRPLAQAEAGDVVVIDTTRPVRSGDTLVSPGSEERLAPMEFPDPNLAVTLEPATETDRDAVVATIQRLGSEDPTLLVEEDPETGAIVVAGLGELHLEVFADRVAEEAGRRVRRGRPRIRSRSSIVHRCAAEAECRAASPGRIVWVAAAVELLPTDPDRHAVVRADPELYGPAAAAAVAALREAAAAGVSHAAPLFGAELRLVRLAGDLKAPEALGLAAEAATIALRKAVAAADPFELEPWTRVEIVAPREVLSGILADLQSRGGDVEQVDQTELGALVRCLLPLARAIGLPTQLRSLSRGLAEMVMLPAGYRRIPGPEGREAPEKDAGDLDRGHGAR